MCRKPLHVVNLEPVRLEQSLDGIEGKIREMLVVDGVELAV